MVSALLSPPAVLFQVAVTVSPSLDAPPVPLAPLMLILASVTVGATLSTVRLVVSAVVVVPAPLSAVTETFLLVPSMAPEALAPLAELFLCAVTVSPILYAPPVPEPEDVIEILASVTVGPAAEILFSTILSMPHAKLLAGAGVPELVVSSA